MNDPIRVLIVDDHAIVRQGLRTLLTGMGMDVVGEACSGTEAIQLVQDAPADVMLLDIRMKDMDGLTALPAIKEAAPQTAVIMLTTYANPTYLTEAVQKGASGFLLKESDPDDIVQAIQVAASRRYLFDPALLNMAVAQGQPISEPASSNNGPEIDPAVLEVLSDREQDVLRLLAKGMSNSEISTNLQVSITTVKTHVSHILQKLDVGDRTQAALIATKTGLVN